MNIFSLYGQSFVQHLPEPYQNEVHTPTLLSLNNGVQISGFSQNAFRLVVKLNVHVANARSSSQNEAGHRSGSPPVIIMFYGLSFISSSFSFSGMLVNYCNLMSFAEQKVQAKLQADVGFNISCIQQYYITLELECKQKGGYKCSRHKDTHECGQIKELQALLLPWKGQAPNCHGHHRALLCTSC